MSVGTTTRSHEVYKADKELCVVLKGRVVLEELDAVKQSVLPRITREIDHVYVDLKGVEYVDSAGLGLLIGFKMTSKMQGAGISLMDPNKTVSDVLNISKIDGIFDFLTGRDAQAVRDRLATSANFISGDSSNAGLGAAHMPQINEMLMALLLLMMQKPSIARQWKSNAARP
jgi:anti-sigma B factor antagonist